MLAFVRQDFYNGKISLKTNKVSEQINEFIGDDYYDVFLTGASGDFLAVIPAQSANQWPWPGSQMGP